MMRPIGILGGAFDPVHYGHLHFARSCAEHIGLSEARLMPCNTPPHRSAPVATAADRLAMLRLATADDSVCVVDPCEIERGGVSYTIDTLKILRQTVDGIPICLLIGMDNFRTLDGWHKWQYLLDYAHIIIACRPQYENMELNETLQNTLDQHMTHDQEILHQQSAGSILLPDIAMLDISSTQIRNSFRTPCDMSDQLPKNVTDFIHTQHLYDC